MAAFLCLFLLHLAALAAFRSIAPRVVVVVASLVMLKLSWREETFAGRHCRCRPRRTQARLFLQLARLFSSLADSKQAMAVVARSDQREESDVLCDRMKNEVELPEP